MSLKNTFATNTVSQGSQLDENFTEISNLQLIPCSALGSNSITLTLLSTSQAAELEVMSDGLTFIFPCTASNTGAAQANPFGIGTWPIFKNGANGPTVLSGGEMVTGNIVMLTWFTGLNDGAGGFVLQNPAFTVLPRLYAWGSGQFGQLGLGSLTSYSSPVLVGSSAQWTNVVNGFLFTLAIKGGGLWAWGGNASGQLGQGNTTYYSSPVQIGSSNAWTNIAAGQYFSLGINNGNLFAWGNNRAGQLGTGNTTYYSSPVQVGALTGWTAIAAGSNDQNARTFSLGINAGRLFSWGNNTYGQLGQGNRSSCSSPIQVGSSSSWEYVAAGALFGLSINNGALFSFGQNNQGQLGTGNTTYYSSPVQVGALTGWTAIAAGGGTTSGFSLGIIAGRLCAWGNNAYGQLGQGNITKRSSPVQIGSSASWTSVIAGGNFVLGINNGNLFAWGKNGAGQLGTGNTTYYSSPVQIGTSNMWAVIGAGAGIASFGIIG